MNLLLRVGVNALALWVTTFFISGITAAGPEGQAGLLTTIMTFLVVGAIFGLLNALVKPLLKLLALPLMILTLGLFTFVINALMLQLTSWVTNFTPLSFHIDNFFWDAILGSIIISLVSFAASQVLGDRD